MSGEPTPAHESADAAGARPHAADVELRVCLLGTPRLAWRDGRLHTLQRDARARRRAIEDQHREQRGVAALQRVHPAVAPGETRRAEQADAQRGFGRDR